VSGASSTVLREVPGSSSRSFLNDPRAAAPHRGFLSAAVWNAPLCRRSACSILPPLCVFHSAAAPRREPLGVAIRRCEPAAGPRFRVSNTIRSRSVQRVSGLSRRHFLTVGCSTRRESHVSTNGGCPSMGTERGSPLRVESTPGALRLAADGPDYGAGLGSGIKFVKRGEVVRLQTRHPRPSARPALARVMLQACLRHGRGSSTKLL
jgi:hypothetical protein